MITQSLNAPMRRPKVKVKLDAKVIGYLRVSSSTQDLDNQRLGILDLANRNGWKVTFVEETVSGSMSYKERELGRIVDDLKRGDTLIVSELSRLGRSMLEIMTLVSELLDREINILAIKGNYKLDTSIQSKILTMVLCMASEIERDLIRQRTREALARKKAEGVKLGRPKGVPGKSKLDEKTEEIKMFLGKGLNVTALSKIYDCAWSTMKDFINRKVVDDSKKL